jgi:preprotein translocase subunit SecD
LIAIVANREVYSAPIIQPSQASFTSFEGAGMIEGNFTKAQARQLASQM